MYIYMYVCMYIYICHINPHDIFPAPQRLSQSFPRHRKTCQILGAGEVRVIFFVGQAMYPLVNIQKHMEHHHF